MSKAVHAMIRWVPARRGGRSRPPEGLTYTAVARFEDDRDRWPKAAWSLVVEMVRPYGDEGDAVWAKVRFLVEDAPQEMLSSGARFELCEGVKVVGKGVVMPMAAKPPEKLDGFAMALLG